MDIRTPQTDVEWNAYYALRYKVLREPLGQALGSERNDGDEHGIHLALFDEGQILAIARLDISEEKVGQVRFVAVDDSDQGKGFGKMIMLSVEETSIQRGDVRMILQAREESVNFYLSTGYKVMSKSHLLFGQIQHFLMEKIY